MKKSTVLLFILVPVLLAGCAKAKPEVAAEVNGEKITYAEVEKELLDLKASKPKIFEGTPGQEFEQEILKYILQTFIDSKLILAEAKKAGLKVTDLEVETEINKVSRMYTDYDTFLQQLKASGMDYAIFKELYRKNMTIKAMREKITTQVKVSEAEAKEYYKAYPALFTDTSTGSAAGRQKPFETVEQSIKDKLIKEKKEDVVKAWIEGLRKKADIQIFI